MRRQTRHSQLRRSLLWDQLFSFFGEVKNYFPWVSFLAGLGGSLHCVGMCGGLVTATCTTQKDVFRYQIGRLVGYLSLGVVAGGTGLLVGKTFQSPWLPVLGALLMGGLFIFWGIRSYGGRRVELPLPKFLNRTYQILWGKLIHNNSGLSRSFFTGLISILLPCGLLYGIVLSTLAMGSLAAALTSMFFFWLGTVPAMVVAPTVVRKLLNPFRHRLPRGYAISLVLLGLLTISYRLFHLPSSIAGTGTPPEQATHSCH
jgi:uncharacterized protein